jgi:hypothetical protein
MSGTGSGTGNNQSREERAGMRDELFEMAGGKLQWEVRARKIFKHGPTATMLRELLFWTGKKNMDKEDYVYITTEQWWEQEGLSYRGIKTARYNLGAEGFGILEEKRAGIPCKLFYRLDLRRLRKVMFKELEDPPKDDPVPENKVTLNHDSRVTTSVSQELSLRSVKSDQIDHSQYNESTQQALSSSSEFHSGSSPKQVLRSPPKMEKPEENKSSFPGDLEAIKGDLDNLVEQAMDDFADPEELKRTADEAGYYFMSSAENVTTSQQHAVFGAIREAKAKIDATTSFPLTSLPCGKNGSDEAVNDLPGVYVASSMGEALLQAIDEAVDSLDEAVDTEERRGFKKLLLQWRHAREKETAQCPPDAPVTAADGPARPVHRPADQKSVQGILDAVEIESF